MVVVVAVVVGVAAWYLKRGHATWLDHLSARARIANSRRAVRREILPCIVSVVVLAVVAWFIL